MRLCRTRWVLACSLVAGCSDPPRDDAFAGDTSSASDTMQPASSTSSGGEDETGEDGDKLDIGIAPDVGNTTPPSEASCDDLEDLPTNQGCEFWAVDLPNVSSAPLAVTPHDQQFALVVTNSLPEQTANVEIFVGSSETPIDSGTVPSDAMRVFQLPTMSVTPGATTADGTAYRIVTDVPITAYQFQPLDNTNPVYSNDATILFPAHVLDQDYTAITADATLASSDAFSASDANTGAFVSVVATEDGTTVTLFPTAELHPGSVTDVVLDRGQVLTAISSERGAPSFGNLSGSRVVADAPVAVFSGSVATSEPSINASCCADHVEHQMLPLTAWGSGYVAAPAAAAQGSGNDASMFRVTGAADGTVLEYSPIAPEGAPATIDAYETVAFITDVAFSVRSADGEPFAVSQFLLSNQYFGGLGGRPGDPSMMLLAAVEQFQDRYVFLMPQGYASNYVTVAAPADTVLTLDGSPVPASLTPMGQVDGVAFGYAHLSVAAGPHVIEGDLPFGIVVSGHADDVSYGYVGGSGVAKIAEPPPLPPPAG
ncbi:MAG: IgGFc-binding protein [Nannocystales bacterium]